MGGGGGPDASRGRTTANAVVSTTATFKLSLHPSAMADSISSLAGATELLDGMLMRHHDQLGGVLVSYENAKIEKKKGPARIVHMAGYVDLFVKANVQVFKPKVGRILTGVVNKIGVDFIGALVLNTFNVSIAAEDLPQDFVHNPVDSITSSTLSGGVWESAEDGGTHRIGVGSILKFQVKKISEYDDVLHLIGSLAEDGTGSAEFLGAGSGVEKFGDVGDGDAQKTPSSKDKKEKKSKTPKSEKSSKKEKKEKKSKREREEKGEGEREKKRKKK
tara:strand:- start:5946 stop:6770 length:825 start_codon:yes stop_codon:yes gene_type:complete